jgi:ribonuclease BN (tRNA processing enzyme)
VQYGGNTSCVEVRTADGALIVLDAGTGLRELGTALASDAEGARGSPDSAIGSAAKAPAPVQLFLSHLHCDHVIGLPHFAPMLNGRRDVAMRCGQAAPDVLRALIQPMFSVPFFPPVTGALDRVRYLAWDGVVDVSSAYRVRRLAARHPGSASIILVEDDAGLILAYAPDNELGYSSNDSTVHTWRDALAEQLQGVPLLLHDATYTDDELPHHQGWGHSSAREAARFAVQCNAKQLLLFHHHPDRDDGAVTRMVVDAEALVRSQGASTMVSGATEGRTLLV